MFLKQTHRCPLSAKNCQPLRIFKFNYTFKQESCQILFCHTQRYCFAMHTSTVLPYTPVLLCHTQRQRFVIHNGTGVPYAKVLFCLAQQKTVILIDNVYQYTDNKTRGKTMATAQTQIRIDSNIKKQASDLFATLGLDLSSAVNLFCASALCGKACLLQWNFRTTAKKLWMPWKKPGVFLQTLLFLHIKQWKNLKPHLRTNARIKTFSNSPQCV